MTKDEALKLALEALEFYYDLYKEKVDANAITAIKEALAQSDQEPDDLTIAYMSGFHDGKNKCTPQPEQEPVAWMREDEDCTDCIVWEQTEEHTIPLYTTPPQRTWIGLTDEDKNNCLVSADPCECLAKPESHQLMEDVEAKVREKNSC